VSDDNAAAALDTAKTIVDNLQALGLNASVGVTVGRAYCGLVGSAKRHEYAVMGPSTNLSARLMCKAPPGGIICDFETHNRDRTHKFQTLATVTAKGYKAPVETFMPVFSTQMLSSILSSKINRSLQSQSNDNDVMSVVVDTDDALKSKISKAAVFFSVQEQSYHCNTNGTRLYGREMEVDQCLASLFGSNLAGKANAGPMSPKTSRNGRAIPTPPLFSLDTPTRVVSLQGSHGIGNIMLDTLSLIPFYVFYCHR
jgi:hypothetical protein